MPPSRAECVGNGNKGISISFVIVPMAITLRCHSYGSKHMMDGRIESGMKKWVFYSTSTELFLALVGTQMQVFSCLFFLVLMELFQILMMNVLRSALHQ